MNDVDPAAAVRSLAPDVGQRAVIETVPTERLREAAGSGNEKTRSVAAIAVGSRPLSQFLRMAVIAGVESAVRVHIDRGDDLNARDSNGMTPLMLSAARNKPDICKLLLDAGVDHSLLDPSGKSALAIALAAGASEAAAILEAIKSSPTRSPDSGPEPASEFQPAGGRPAAGAEAEMNKAAAASVQVRAGAVGELRAPVMLPSAIGVDETFEFDLSGWEAEGETSPPSADPSVLRSAVAIQSTITSHEPIDSSAEWGDVDAHLPDHVLPLARTADVEARTRLRRLLLRAIREGSVPSLDVQDLSIDDDGSADPDTEALLVMVINDLGAEVDERFEYSDAFQTFEVFVAPEETPAEEAALDEALAVIEKAASPRGDPVRMYLRELQRLRLLSADEEVEMAKAMEDALKDALDALAAWPQGMARTLAAGAEVMSGARPLAWMSLWDADSETGAFLADGQGAESDETEVGGGAADADDESGAGSRLKLGDRGFVNALAALDALTAVAKSQDSACRAVRDALEALRLNRRFLLELGDTLEPSEARTRYTRSMKAYLQARDRMAAANLKLAFFHARKYLYSGEPLGDLAQEANIGLLKAVDRFDWRRGYKFSTYATWWIRQQVGRYVADKGRTIRLPVHVHEKVQRLQREVQALESALGREPALEDIAARTELPAHQVAKLLRIAPEPLSIHELPIDEMIAVDSRDAFTESDPADVVEATELRAALDGLLLSLSTNEEQIVRLRFGFGVSEFLTLEEIGQRYAVTRERIRQIESKALEKLRHPARAEPFARFVLGIRCEVNPPAQGPDHALDKADALGLVPAPGARRQGSAPRASR
jgi:RNA polymerase primary sigma factor